MNSNLRLYPFSSGWLLLGQRGDICENVVALDPDELVWKYILLLAV